MNTSLTHRTGTLLAPQLDYILLDGSGSMFDKWHATLGGLEGFVNVLRSQNIASHGILNIFSGRTLERIVRDDILANWQTLRYTECPGDVTPLYDAINLMGRRIRDLAPPHASIVIATDGDEYGSRHTTAEQARAILDWLRAKGYQVTFLGCDFNNARQAALLGSTPQNTIDVRKEKLLEAGKTLGEKRARNVLTGDDINFTDDEKENFGGYLTGPAS